VFVVCQYNASYSVRGGIGELSRGNAKLAVRRVVHGVVSVQSESGVSSTLGKRMNALPLKERVAVNEVESLTRRRSKLR
jgi:hypothetical protein